MEFPMRLTVSLLTAALVLATPALARSAPRPAPTPASPEKRAPSSPAPQSPKQPGLKGLLEIPGLRQLLQPGGDPGQMIGQLMPLMMGLMPLLQRLVQPKPVPPVVYFKHGSIYIIRGDEIFRLDRKTLEIQAHVTLPGVGGGAPGLPLGLLLPGAK